MKKIFLVLLLIGGIALLGSEVFNTSFAYSYDIDNSVLFYKNDYEALEKDIEIYLSNIDDFIIPNSSFMYSDVLRDNYDFLVHFALDYVLDNKEYYSEGLKKLDNCLYVDKDGIENLTLDYVNLDIIYEITDFYFGISDFSIINNDVCIIDNYVSLSDYANDRFEFLISNVSVYTSGEDIKAIVNYENGNSYLYTFYNDNNVLKIRDVEVWL
ncbi:MAG: hypothetical protein IJ509_03090 [Bacilli bacterium]|nr:hypothetical protein [Bacilli bacterium]